jgi:hypothetical protein
LLTSGINHGLKAVVNDDVRSGLKPLLTSGINHGLKAVVNDDDLGRASALI